MNLTPSIIDYTLLALVPAWRVCAGLAVYRNPITTQVAINLEIHKIDRMGEVLTVATVVCGLAIAAAYLCGAWQASEGLR